MIGLSEQEPWRATYSGQLLSADDRGMEKANNDLSLKRHDFTSLI